MWFYRYSYNYQYVNYLSVTENMINALSKACQSKPINPPLGKPYPSIIISDDENHKAFLKFDPRLGDVFDYSSDDEIEPTGANYEPGIPKRSRDLICSYLKDLGVHATLDILIKKPDLVKVSDILKDTVSEIRGYSGFYEDSEWFDYEFRCIFEINYKNYHCQDKQKMVTCNVEVYDGYDQDLYNIKKEQGYQLLLLHHINIPMVEAIKDESIKNDLDCSFLCQQLSRTQDSKNDILTNDSGKTSHKECKKKCYHLIYGLFRGSCNNKETRKNQTETVLVPIISSYLDM